MDDSPLTATTAGTAAYAARAVADLGLPADAYRQLESAQRSGAPSLAGLTVSSLGLGTYLGDDSVRDDERAYDAAVACLRGGINLLDSAINYRAQRSERVLGQVLAQLPRLGLRRDQVVVCTKAGFLYHDGTVPRDGAATLRRVFVDSGLCPPETLAGVHCLHPAFLRDAVEKSLRNLRLAHLDVFYLHNPEAQLDSVPRAELRARLRAA